MYVRLHASAWNRRKDGESEMVRRGISGLTLELSYIPFFLRRHLFVRLLVCLVFFFFTFLSCFSVCLFVFNYWYVILYLLHRWQTTVRVYMSIYMYICICRCFDTGPLPLVFPIEKQKAKQKDGVSLSWYAFSFFCCCCCCCCCCCFMMAVAETTMGWRWSSSASLDGCVAVYMYAELASSPVFPFLLLCLSPSSLFQCDIVAILLLTLKRVFDLAGVLNFFFSRDTFKARSVTLSLSLSFVPTYSLSVPVSPSPSSFLLAFLWFASVYQL